MKKTFSLLSLGILSIALSSCAKNEKTEISTETELVDSASAETAATEYLNPKDQLIKQAQSHPITNATLSSSHYDFKDVKKGEVVEHDYEITNTGSNPLIISEVKPGCGCTAPKFTNTPILPGEKGHVTLKFDSSSFDGPQSKQAEVYLNVENAPIILSFTANVVQ